MSEQKNTSDSIVQLIYTNNDNQIKLTGELVYENEKYIVISSDNKLKFDDCVTSKQLVMKNKITKL
jgi:hypothetical protein